MERNIFCAFTHNRMFVGFRLAQISLVLLVILSIVSLPLTANDELFGGSQLNKTGLTIVWFTEAGAGAGREITDWTLNVDENKPTTYFVVEAGNYREMISQNSLNAFGEPFGLDGAVAYIEVRKEVLDAELKNEGNKTVEVKINQYTIPKTTIYALSTNSVLTAIDADTGHEDWTCSIGSSHLPCIGVGSCNEYVAAINGSSVYCYEAATGKLLWSHACKYGVAAAPAVSSDHVYVPLLNGRIEVFEMDKKGYGSYPLVAGGIATARPLVTEKTISWPTNRGELNVSSSTGSRQHSIHYRLLASGSIESTPTFKDNLLFATSLDGFVYAIEEDRGILAWEVSTGAQISQSPVVLGDSVYAITDDHRMYRMDARTGKYLWPAPLEKIGRYVGASRDKIYAMDGFGGLLVIDPDSAAILSRVEIGDVRFVLPNRQSDRLYVASGTGVIQCIHETGSQIPFFHASEIAKSRSLDKAVATPVPDDSDGGAEVSAEVDPFKTLNNAEKKTAPEGDEDPFATDK